MKSIHQRSSCQHFRKDKMVRGFFAFLTIVGLVGPALDVPVAHAEKSKAQCKGKLGVHRTIKVSQKNAVLVGVGNHGRLGLRPGELILTFDDGPRPSTTPQVLKALAEECVKATFFSLGRAARAHPALLQRTAREGHTIASHTQSHPLLTKQNSETVRAEIRRGIRSVDVALQGSGHKASNFFRYPFLDRSQRTDAIVKEKGLVAFHMNIDSWDWREQTPEEMVALTMSRVRNEGSGVILLHDIQDRTAAGLPLLLQAIKAEGYKIVHVVPGESDFDFRKDLAEQRVARTSKRKASKGEKVAALSSPNSPSVRKIKAKKTKIKQPKIRFAKAPLPKPKPRLPGAPTGIETALGLRDSLSASANDGRLLTEPTRGSGSQTQVANLPKQKKKRFRIFRRLFGRNQ